MSRTINDIAVAAASRVPDGSVGLDPATIITIFMTVIPLVTQCFMRNDEDDPQAVQAAVKEAHERHPRALLRRTTNRIYRTSETPITKTQAEELAKATIAEALESDDVADYCASVRGAA